MTTIYWLRCAAEDARPGIKTAAREETAMGEFLRTHVFGLKWNHVVTIAIVEPPGVVQQPSLRLHPLVQWGARKWRDVIEGRNEQPLLLGKRNRRVKCFRRVVI